MRLPPLGGLYVAGGQNGADPIGCGAFCPPRMEKGRERMMMQIHLNEDDLRDKDGKPITAKKALEMLGFSIEDLRDEKGNLPPKITIRFVKNGAGILTDKEDKTGVRTVKAESHRVANDKVTAKFFNPTTKQWERGLMNIWENPNDKKRKKEIITPITFKSIEEGKIVPRCNSFDRAVFTACYSLQAAGNLTTTTDIIFAHMTGKDGRARPSDEMRRKIKDSIIKMSGCWVKIDTEEVNSAYGYKAENTIEEGQLLYARFKQTVVNGKITNDAVIFVDTSPLVKVAETRNQILSYPMELLDVPVSASEESIIVREELLRRIYIMLKHGTEKSIRFKSLLEPIGYENMTKAEKLRERKKVIKMLDTWKAKGLFKDYTIKKDGNIPVKIVIDTGRARAGK